MRMSGQRNHFNTGWIGTTTQTPPPPKLAIRTASPTRRSAQCLIHVPLLQSITITLSHFALQHDNTHPVPSSITSSSQRAPPRSLVSYPQPGPLGGRNRPPTSGDRPTQQDSGASAKFPPTLTYPDPWNNKQPRSTDCASPDRPGPEDIESRDAHSWPSDDKWGQDPPPRQRCPPLLALTNLLPRPTRARVWATTGRSGAVWSRETPLLAGNPRAGQ